MNNDSSLVNPIAKTAAVTMLLLLIPFTAQLITDEMNWTLSDFVLAGFLIFGTGLAYVLITRKADNLLYRVGWGLTLFTVLFMVWVNLAVGIIGSEDNPGNLMYFAVIVILLFGILASRFRSRGMSFALISAALAQAATIPYALLNEMQTLPGSSVSEIVLVNGLFITLFMISGILFWNASGRIEQS